MAFSEEDSMKSITSQAFFNNVSLQGFPTPKQQSQRWKDFGLPQPMAGGTMQKQPEDSKMVVLCSMKHDYGSSGLGGY